MSKATVTRLFIGSLIAALAGAILIILAVSVALANDVFVLDGAELVDIRPHRARVGPARVRARRRRRRSSGGAIGGLVSWIGALLNTSQLTSKAWFLGPAAPRDLQLRHLRDDRVRLRRARRQKPTDGSGPHARRPPRTVGRLIRDPRAIECAEGAHRGRRRSDVSDDRQDRPDHRGDRWHRQGDGDRARVHGCPRGHHRPRPRPRRGRPPPRSPATSGNPAIDVFVGDLSSQAEVRRLAAEVLAAYPRLDVLLNNVGGFWAHRHVTADGLEHTFALNHLAPFLLTNLLLDRLIASAPARIVTVSSGAQSMGTIDFDDLMGERKYSGQDAYNQSKLANVMFTYELARRLEGTGVTATALHPGLTNTAFGAEDAAR